jgi:hypothetical protein
MLIARARVLNQIGDYEGARADLRIIAAASPRDPFWITPRALLGLSSLAANLGEQDSAAASAQRVIDDPGYARYHDHARSLLARRVSPRQQQIFVEIARARRQLFGGDGGPDSASATLAGIRARYGDEPMLTFLEAECDRRIGDVSSARSGYESILKGGTDPGFEAIRLTSLVRLGEIEIAAGRFNAAELRYQEARRMESGATLLGNMIRGRLRFIAARKDGGSGGKKDGEDGRRD